MRVKEIKVKERDLEISMIMLKRNLKKLQTVYSKLPKFNKMLIKNCKTKKIIVCCDFQGVGGNGFHAHQLERCSGSAGNSSD